MQDSVCTKRQEAITGPVVFFFFYIGRLANFRGMAVMSGTCCHVGDSKCTLKIQAPNNNVLTRTCTIIIITLNLSP